MTVFDVNEKLSPHFTLREFLKDGNPEGLTVEIVANLKSLAIHLEDVRKLLGNRPLRITSGFRSIQEHLRIYAAMGITDKRRIPMKSYHLYGMAADFMVIGMSSAAARRILDPIWPYGMEIGTPHVHLDLRPKKERFPPK